MCLTLRCSLCGELVYIEELGEHSKYCAGRKPAPEPILIKVPERKKATQ